MSIWPSNPKSGSSSWVDQIYRLLLKHQFVHYYFKWFSRLHRLRALIHDFYFWFLYLQRIKCLGNAPVFSTSHQEEMLVWGIYLSVETLVVTYKDLPIGVIQSLHHYEGTYKRYLQYHFYYYYYFYEIQEISAIFSQLWKTWKEKNTLTETFIAQTRETWKI